MKKRLRMFLMLSLLILPLGAQSPDQIIQTLNRVDVTAFYQFLGSDVNLTIEKENAELKKEQAVVKLNDFFKKNNLTKFQLKHQGDRDGSAYIVGTLFTVNGEFRLIVL